MSDSEADSRPLNSYTDLTELFRDPDDTAQKVVQSVFGLNRPETRAYLALVEYPHNTVKGVADVLDRHHSHVARSFRGLLEVGLVEREQRIFDNGGSGYIYEPVPVDEAQCYLQNQLDEWVEALQNEVERFDETVEAETGTEHVESTEEPECSRGEGD